MLWRRPQEERKVTICEKAGEEGRNRVARTVYGSVRGKVVIYVRRRGAKGGHENITWLIEGAGVEQKGQGDGGSRLIKWPWENRVCPRRIRVLIVSRNLVGRGGGSGVGTSGNKRWRCGWVGRRGQDR